MARNSLLDFLSVFPFWLVDVGPLDSFSLPIFNPLAGFASISAPEINVETDTIQEANYFLDKKVVKRANVSSITLTKGVTATSAGFWEWVTSALKGEPVTQVGWIPYNPAGFGLTYRRNLMLLHFYRGPVASPRTKAGTNAGIADRAALIGAGVLATGGSAGAAAGLAGALALVAKGGTLLGGFEFAARVPARAFLLYDCVPKRYKTGSDFDARSGDISISEMEFELETFEEVSLLG